MKFDLLSGDNQGKAEGDVLENMVNGLADILGLQWRGADRLKGSPEGNTWAITDAAQLVGYTDRTTFSANQRGAANQRAAANQDHWSLAA